MKSGYQRGGNGSSAMWSALLAGALVLAACGTDDGNGDDASAAGGAGSDDASQEEDPVELIYSIAQNEDDGLTRGTNWFIEQVEERSDGAITFDTFYSSSLLTPLESYEGVLDGRADISWTPAANYYPSQFPLLEMMGMPFDVSNGAAMELALFDMYQENDAFRSEFEEAGVHVLHFMAYSPTVAGVRGQLESVEDFQGERLRALGEVAEVVSAVGAEPVAMDLTELYEGIQQGLVSGFATFPFESVRAQSLDETVDQLVDYGYGHNSVSAVSINLERWNGLSDEQRDLIAVVAEELQRERSAEFLGEMDETACEAMLEGANPEIVVWGDDEVAAFQEAVGDGSLERWRTLAMDAGLEEGVVDDFREEFLARYEENVELTPYESGVAACAERQQG